MSLRFDRFLALAFAPCPILAFVVPKGIDCYAEARRDGLQFFLSCNIEATCEKDGGLCDYHTAQVGERFYHGCRCDGQGEDHASCDGYLISEESDPGDSGYDVLCYQHSTPCTGSDVCDEEQLPSTHYTRLCVCK